MVVWVSGSLRSLLSSPTVPTRDSPRTATSASVGSSIPAGTSCTTCMGILLCLSSQPPPWDVPSVTPLSLRGVWLVRLPCTAWQPRESSPPTNLDADRHVRCECAALMHLEPGLRRVEDATRPPGTAEARGCDPAGA